MTSLNRFSQSVVFGFAFGVSTWVGITALADSSRVSADGSRVSAGGDGRTKSVNVPDGVVAVVNAEPITRNQLAGEAVKRYGREVLDGLVNRSLILQECERRGLTVGKSEVNAEIQRQAKKFGLGVDQYLGLLQEERDIHPAQYGREIVWPMLALRRLAADQVTVSQEEFNKGYTARYGEAVKCRMIMVADRGTALRLHAEAKADPDSFGELAKQNSDDEMSAPVGGLVPPFRKYSGEPSIEEAVFALEGRRHQRGFEPR